MAIEIRLRVCATVIRFCRRRSVVACCRIGATVNLIHIAYSIIVDIRRTIASTDAQRIFFISLAIAIRCWNVCAAAFVNSPRAVANSTSIEGTDTGVDVIANAIRIGIRHTSSSAFSQRIQLVALAVAIILWNACTTAGVNRPRAVADATRVIRPDARVNIVAQPISIGIRSAVAAAFVHGIQDGTRAIIICGIHIIIARRSIGATRNLQRIAHSVIVCVCQAIPVASVSKGRIRARAVIVGSGGIIIAGGAVIATVNFEGVAHIVSICVSSATARAIQPKVRVRARSIGLCRQCVVIARCAIGAAVDFEGIACSIVVGIYQAFARTVIPTVRVRARSRVRGLRVVIASVLVLASLDFQCVTHTISIFIFQANAIAGVARCGKCTAI